MFDLAGRPVVVTGAAGQLGREFCRALLSHGARVAALDLLPGAEATARFGALADEKGFRYIESDVTHRDRLEAALGAIEAEWGTPFGLVNNAGIDAPPDAPAAENGPFEEYPKESFERVMAVNATGPLLCAQVFGAAMARAGRGSIVSIGSIYGSVSPVQDIYAYRRASGAAYYKPVAYSMSKASLHLLTRYLATYWGKNGVRVNLLTLAGVANRQDPRFLDGYLPRLPLGRMARADEYGGALVFLMSDAASYMTGADLVLDGGWTAW